MDLQSIYLSFSVLGILGAFVWWVFVTFYRKEEALRLEREIRSEVHKIGEESRDRNNKLEQRIERIESGMNKIAADTSYIRGKLESWRGQP